MAGSGFGFGIDHARNHGYGDVATSANNQHTGTGDVIPIAFVPVNYAVGGGTLGDHLAGIDAALLSANNTLDDAYDQGGPGAGRTITVDSGAVRLSGSGAHTSVLQVDEGGAGLGVWFSDGDLVLGAAAMSGTERLRVVGTTRLEGSTTLTTGQHLVPNGTNGAPSYSFTSGTAMGMYRAAAGVLGLSASGGEGFSIDRTNNVDGLTAVGDFVVLRPLGIGSDTSVAVQFDFGLGGAIARVNMQPQAGNSIASLFLSPSGTQTRTFFQMRNDSDQSNTGRLIFDFSSGAARLTTDTGGTGTSADTMEFGETGGSGTGGFGTLTNIGFFFSGVEEATIASNGEVQAGFGVEGTPGLSFTGDEDTGIWRAAANQMAFSVAGGEAMRLDASGVLLVGVTAAAGAELFRVAGASLLGGDVEIDGALNHDGASVGFFGAAPVAQDTGWSVTNVTPDRSYDANSTSLDEIADVLGTLITYLLSRGDIGA